MDVMDLTSLTVSTARTSSAAEIATIADFLGFGDLDSRSAARCDGSQRRYACDWLPTRFRPGSMCFFAQQAGRNSGLLLIIGVFCSCDFSYLGMVISGRF